MDFAAIVAQLAQGVAYTVVVTLCCAATGLLTGLLVAGLWRLNVRWLRWLLDAYTFVLRGVPVLVVTFIAMLELSRERLVDVTQDVIVNMLDCGTQSGIWVRASDDAGGQKLKDRVIGRATAADLKMDSFSLTSATTVSV